MDFVWVLMCGSFLWGRVVWPAVEWGREGWLVLVWSGDNWYLRNWEGGGCIGVSVWVVAVIVVGVVVSNVVWVGDMVRFSRKDGGGRRSGRTVEVSREDGFVKKCK